MTRIRAQFDGKVLVPLDAIKLPQGQIIEIDIDDGRGAQRGTAQAVLAAMARGPKVSRADADALLEAIDQGKLPIKFDAIFQDDESR